MTGGATVVSMDSSARARRLAAGWRRAPLSEVATRCRALAMLQATGVRLPADAWEAWVQMSAVLVVAGKPAGGREMGEGST